MSTSLRQRSLSRAQWCLTRDRLVLRFKRDAATHRMISASFVMERRGADSLQGSSSEMPLLAPPPPPITPLLIKSRFRFPNYFTHLYVCYCCSYRYPTRQIFMHRWTGVLRCLHCVTFDDHTDDFCPCLWAYNFEGDYDARSDNWHESDEYDAPEIVTARLEMLMKRQKHLEQRRTWVIPNPIRLDSKFLFNWWCVDDIEKEEERLELLSLLGTDIGERLHSY